MTGEGRRDFQCERCGGQVTVLDGGYYAGEKIGLYCRHCERAMREKDRPVAWRVSYKEGGHNLFVHEHVAQEVAAREGTTYEGLYVRAKSE